MRIFAVAMILQMLAAPLWASTECAEEATGSQSGSSYTLIGQATKEVTMVVELDGPSCGTNGGTRITVTETYTVGYYANQTTGQIALVNCATGRILGWS